MNDSKVMKCSRRAEGRKMNVAMNGELHEEVESYTYLNYHVAVDGGLNVYIMY